MMKSCSYCGRIHPKGYTCPLKPKTGLNRKKKRSEADRFRGTEKWRKLSESIRDRDKHICQACLNNLGSQFRIRIGEPVEVHHIWPLEISFEKRDEENNLITLCKRHHEEAEAGKISVRDLEVIAEKNNRNDVVEY